MRAASFGRHGRRAGWVAVCVFVNAAARPECAPAQEPQGLTIAPTWEASRYLGNRATLEFSLSRPLAAPDERLALMVGQLDVSALVEVRGQRASYRPTAARLPAGESEVVAYRVDRDGAWTEIGRTTLRVLNAFGLESGAATASADLSSSGQLDQSVAEGEPPPDRNTYQDVTLNLALQGQAVRSGWQVALQSSAIGVTQKFQRLRWGELEEDAPPVDLSDYRIQVTRGGTSLSLGNVTAGWNRYLLEGFGSRGFAGSARLGSMSTVDAAVVNGTNVVGWTNMLGMQEPSHRIETARVAFEVAPDRPGALHVDVTGVDASVLPLSSFNQGAATDAEESRGMAVEVAASDAGQRIRFSGGVARSRFVNPADPLLDGDTTVVAVEPTSRTARHGELNLQILQNLAVTDATFANLGASFRHERVDPLYRSVGAYVSADMESNGVDLNGSFGPVSVQAGLATSHDNLDEIASILTTRTKSRNLVAAVPLGALVGDAESNWWPNANWSFQRMHQYGDGVPVNSGFSDSHVPDQWSTNQSVQLAWSGSIWTAGYRWNQSFQDNRQTGREQSDFRSTAQGPSFGLNLSSGLTASTDASFEQQKNYELDVTSRMTRVGASLQWKVFLNTALSGSFSRGWGRDPLSEQRTRNAEQQIELSQGFSLYQRSEFGTQGRIYVRYSRSRAAILPFSMTAPLPRVFWTISAGGSLKLF